MAFSSPSVCCLKDGRMTWRRHKITGNSLQNTAWSYWLSVASLAKGMFTCVKADVQRDGLGNTVVTKERMKAFKQGIHLLLRK